MTKQKEILAAFESECDEFANKHGYEIYGIVYNDRRRSSEKDFYADFRQGATESSVVLRLESALKSLVGFEPFDSLEPLPASKALDYLSMIRGK